MFLYVQICDMMWPMKKEAGSAKQAVRLKEEIS